MNQDKLIEELNQLLKGTHMGAYVFQDLRAKLQSPDVIKEFDRILEIISNHEKSLTKEILMLHGEPVDSAGIMGTMSEFMTTIKNLVLADDAAVISEAVKSIEMGGKAIRDFDEEHYTLHKPLQKTIRILEDDYSSIYHTLHHFLIEYK